MGDEQQHNLSACPNFKALSVEERLSGFKSIGRVFAAYDLVIGLPFVGT